MLNIEEGVLSNDGPIRKSVVIKVGKCPLVRVPLEVRRNVGAQRAELGFRTGIDAELEAGDLVPSIIGERSGRPLSLSRKSSLSIDCRPLMSPMPIS